MSLEPSSDRISEDWPTCPGCGERRSTACPYCHTAGADFRAAHSGFGRIPGLPECGEASGPCCGPGGCHSEHVQDEDPEPEAESEPTSPAAAPMVLCPTCDEPFIPQYLLRCEWCGHEFPDGVELDRPTEMEDSFNPRIAIVIVAILLLSVGAIVYFTRLF